MALTKEEIKVAQAIAFTSDNSHCIAEITVPLVFNRELPAWAVVLINKLHLVKLFNTYSYYVACAQDTEGYYVGYTNPTFNFEEAFSHINRRELTLTYDLY